MFTIQMIFKASALLVLLLTWAACLCWSACLVINYALAKSGRQGKAWNCLRTGNSALIRVTRTARTLITS